jgi:2,4-dienoyl-CoA reductase (NADPH2)
VNDYLPDGQQPEEFLAIAKEVEAEGIDFVALSAGAYETMGTSAPPLDCALLDGGEARLFKEGLTVPVIAQGLHDPRNATRAIAEGHSDFVMLARPLLADPDYVAKLREGLADEITICGRDNYCMRRMVFGMPVRCRANPEMGRESRAKGEIRPLRRWIKAPFEELVLNVTGSKTIMGLVGKLLPKNSA